MSEGGRQAAQAGAFTNAIENSKSSQHGKRPDRPRHPLWDSGKLELRLLQQELARLGITAMGRAVGKRPDGARGLRICPLRAEKPCTKAKQDAATKAQAIRLPFVPGKWLQQGQPRIF